MKNRKKYRFSDGLKIEKKVEPKEPKEEPDVFVTFRRFYPDGKIQEIKYKKPKDATVKLIYNDVTKRVEPDLFRKEGRGNNL